MEHEASITEYLDNYSASQAEFTASLQEWSQAHSEEVHQSSLERSEALHESYLEHEASITEYLGVQAEITASLEEWSQAHSEEIHQSSLERSEAQYESYREHEASITEYLDIYSASQAEMTQSLGEWSAAHSDEVYQSQLELAESLSQWSEDQAYATESLHEWSVSHPMIVTSHSSAKTFASAGLPTLKASSLVSNTKTATHSVSVANSVLVSSRLSVRSVPTSSMVSSAAVSSPHSIELLSTVEHVTISIKAASTSEHSESLESDLNASALPTLLPVGTVNTDAKLSQNSSSIADFEQKYSSYVALFKTRAPGIVGVGNDSAIKGMLSLVVILLSLL